MTAEIPSVADVMTGEPRTIAPHERLFQAARELELGFIRHLPVVDEQGALVGILSLRDIVAVGDLDAPVADAMTTDVKVVTPETPAYEAAYLLLNLQIGCLPVVGEGGRLVGIVTESDFVRIAYTLLGGRVPIDQLELEEHEADKV